MPDALIARGREVVAPGEIENLGAEAGRNFFRAVGRTGIDDDDLVDKVRGRLQATRQLLFLIPDHQAKRYAHGCHLLGESLPGSPPALSSFAQYIFDFHNQVSRSASISYSVLAVPFLITLVALATRDSINHTDTTPHGDMSQSGIRSSIYLAKYASAVFHTLKSPN